MNPSHAADSSTPVPSAFTTSTRPARTAPSSPGTPSAESAAQLHRVAEIIVEAAEDRVHTAQTRERLQVHRIARAR